jgi:hypothetical protein
MDKTDLARFLENVPSSEEVRARIAENTRERQVLRRVLKLADDREQAKKSCERGVAQCG